MNLFEELDLKIAEPKADEAGYVYTSRCTYYSCPRTSQDGCSTNTHIYC